jgi:CRISPR-associated endonuclease/helicase Cas3
MSEIYYAHAIEGKPISQWQTLEDHLKNTAKRAGEMAAEFGCYEWGYLVGLWHDLGKYSHDFQQYLIDSCSPIPNEDKKHKIIDHSSAGALYSVQKFNTQGRLLAYPIAGHHAGLADYESDAGNQSSLSQRLNHHEFLEIIRSCNIPNEILDYPFPSERPNPGADPALWLRLLFSCLVDADFLDTEYLLNPTKANIRKNYRPLTELLPLFSDYMQKKESEAPKTDVNTIRSQILKQCIKKSSESPNIYTLTVPTGGGKTLASMAFALNHALKYKKNRIIYVIPYTSIIEQTADQFRRIFGNVVIEHHSNLDTSDIATYETYSNLACENWDAPVIVTTSIQFFESLFASRTSRCRKLHNIVNSVVILDEAQLMPPEYLSPILHVVRELEKNYKVTFLISTATQPAFESQKSFDFNFTGLNTTEIIEDPINLHKQLKRVNITVPADFHTAITWEELSIQLQQHRSVLCIVNSRNDCRTLWNKMPKRTFHLSALMCGAHRSTKIKIIKERLEHDIPTRVISTQLVEAGVDLDFPVVYRALAGLDSVAQAAGRCNREGKSLDKGKVIVFVPPSNIPSGHLRQAAQIGQQLMSQECDDLLSPERFRQFFKEYYWIQGERLDQYKILNDLMMSADFRCSFRSAAMKFHIIDESQYAPVIVTYGEGQDLIEILENNKPERWLLRKVQRYIVNIPRSLHSRYLSEGIIREIHPGIFAQTNRSSYDEEIGFCPDKFSYEPDELII